MPPSSPRPVRSAAPGPPVGSPRPFQGTPVPREVGAQLGAGAGLRPAPVTPSSCGVGVTGSSVNPRGEMPRLRRQGSETPIRGRRRAGAHGAPHRVGTRDLGTPLLRGDPWGPLALCHRPEARCVSRGWEGLEGPGFGDTQCRLAPAALRTLLHPHPPKTPIPPFLSPFFLQEFQHFWETPMQGNPWRKRKPKRKPRLQRRGLKGLCGGSPK